MRYVCIHGHFYQPPRENPWLEAIERQESASPYHDWNERITAECYEPNAQARILDDEGRIADLVDNYSRISFNFGPTLLSWMRREVPAAYEAILEADRRSMDRFDGHGSAIAQAYNHIILPLANRRDKLTQIRWGIADFRFRFGRMPEGMWLAETAVDVESLELMAAEGIRYTILAPHQAASVRAPEGEWEEVDQDRLDTSRAYRVLLPSGDSIAVFFYDGSTSRAVAFERLLADGVRFAERIVEPLEHAESDDPLSHIATDGESYGHHHRHGEMALAYAMRTLEERDDVTLANYGMYLERHPPTWEARIHEDTSWSCAHGVERWRGDCGCAGDPGRGWNQKWRTPLREALDGLRDALAPRYEEEAAGWASDPWAARDHYIEVVLDRARENVQRFLETRILQPDSEGVEREERTRILRLLEMQRQLLLMYTSCGWFFDDISGIETVQVLRYAGRVIHLAGELFGDEVAQGLEREFTGRLDEAVSNVPEWHNGRAVYHRTVDPSRVDLRKAAAHYAVSSLFDEYGDDERIYCYRFQREQHEEHRAGGATLLAGRVRVTSRITRHSETLTYAVLHLGNHNLAGGVRPHRSEDSYQHLVAELRAPFLRTDFTTVLRELDREFEASTYSLRSLFRDAQLRIVDTILESSIEEAEEAFGRLYEQKGPLLRFLADLGVPAPRPFVVAAEYVLNQRLRRILAHREPNLAAVRAALEAATSAAVPLEQETLSYEAETTLERLVGNLEGTPADAPRLARIRELAGTLEEAGLPLDLWKVQNAYWRHLRDLEVPAAGAEGDVPVEAADDDEGGARQVTAADWRRELEALAETLAVRMPQAEEAEREVAAR